MAYAIDMSKVDPFLKFQRIEWYDILLKFAHAFMEHEIMGESSVWSRNFFFLLKMLYLLVHLTCILPQMIWMIFKC